MLLNYMVRNIFIITVGDMLVSTLCDDNLIYYLARAIASRYALRVGLFRRDVLQNVSSKYALRREPMRLRIRLAFLNMIMIYTNKIVERMDFA